MSECFEPSNIVRGLELNFESNHSTKRWRRVKEYIHHLEDDHRQKNLKEVKGVSEYRSLGIARYTPYPKTWLYGHPRAKFSPLTFEDSRKPKKISKIKLC